MAILKIARMGHPVLHRVADPVEDPTSPEVAVTVRDMLETLEDSGGIGLAAPQVHISKRIVLFFVPESRVDEGEELEATDLTVMINPVIEPQSEDMDLDWEACLSVPELMGAVPRYTHIKYRWTNLDGTEEEREARGFHARAVQHECDHLDGILYPMRMTDMSLLGFSEETNRNRDMIIKGSDRAGDGDDD
jgi:peptide deformylase